MMHLRHAAAKFLSVKRMLCWFIQKLALCKRLPACHQAIRRLPCKPHPSPVNHVIATQELVCRERPQRGCLRARRVPEECPASVSALIDACIDGANPALRPSAYEAFQCLAARSDSVHLTSLAILLLLRSDGEVQQRATAFSVYWAPVNSGAWYQALPARSWALSLIINSLYMCASVRTAQRRI